MAVFSDSYLYNAAGIFIALCLGIVTYFKWRYTYWQRKGLPSTKPSIPYGDLKDMFIQRRQIGEIFADIYTKAKAKGYRHIGGYILARPVYVTIDPEIAKSIMVKDFSYFVDRRSYYNEKDDPLSAHLFSIEGEKWKNLRQKFTPTFTTGQLKHMFSTLADCGKNLEDYLEQHMDEPLNSKEILGRFTTDIIASCAFGIQCNTLQTPNSDFRKYGKLIFEQSPAAALNILIITMLPANFLRCIGYKLLRTDVSSFFMKIVEEIVHYRETNNVRRKDFMDLLIRLKNKGTLAENDQTDINKDKNNTPTLTLKELAAQSLVFYGAGFETSSSAMNYALFELAQNQVLQDKVRKEIRTVLERHDGKISYDAIMEMQLLSNIVDGMLPIIQHCQLNKHCT